MAGRFCRRYSKKALNFNFITERWAWNFITKRWATRFISKRWAWNFTTKRWARNIVYGTHLELGHLTLELGILLFGPVQPARQVLSKRKKVFIIFAHRSALSEKNFGL